MKALIRAVQPNYIDPSKKTFSQNTSDYKSCRMNGSTYTPFTDRVIVDDFSTETATDFSRVISRMKKLTSTFLDSVKYSWLVIALIETIQEDSSIQTDQGFQIGDGHTVTKSQLADLTELDVTAFLTGVFAFIIINRQDNRLGAATFNSWMKKSVAKIAVPRFPVILVLIERIISSLLNTRKNLRNQKMMKNPNSLKKR